jgi:ATP-dependent RNA circularization protein (DNA/RNA ligase family)
MLAFHFIMVLFTMQKHGINLGACQWMNGLRYTHAHTQTQNLSIIQSFSHNKEQSYVVCRKREIITLSEKSQTQEDKDHMFSLLGEI